jgi:hypothetical protein
VGAHKLIGARSDITALEEVDYIVLEETFPFIRKSEGGLDEEGDCKPFDRLWAISGHSRDTTSSFEHGHTIVAFLYITNYMNYQLSMSMASSQSVSVYLVHA